MWSSRFPATTGSQDSRFPGPPPCVCLSGFETAAALLYINSQDNLAADGPGKEATQIFKQVEPGLDPFKHVPGRGLISLGGPHGMLQVQKEQGREAAWGRGILSL